MLPLLLSLALSLTSPARAAEWPDLSTQIQPTNEGRNDAAVVIAIEDYAKVDDVVGARANADQWTRYLVSGRGVPPSRVFSAIDADATDLQIRELAKAASAAVQPGGTLWFVFIGHGAPSVDGQDGLLVGVDADRSAQGIYQRSVSRSELMGLLDAGKQAQTVALLDACFSGQGGDGAALVDGLQPLVPTALTRAASDRSRVLTAAGSGQFSGPLPGAARPAFSYLALGGLLGWADTDGMGNKDGRVSAVELQEYVAGALNVTVRGRRQTPALLGADTDLGKAVSRAAPDLMAMVPKVVVEDPSKQLDRRPIGELVWDDVYGGYIAKSDLDARVANPIRMKKAELPKIGDTVGCGREADALRKVHVRNFARGTTLAIAPAVLASSLYACTQLGAEADAAFGMCVFGSAFSAVGSIPTFMGPQRTYRKWLPELTSSTRSLLSCISTRERHLLTPDAP